MQSVATIAKELFFPKKCFFCQKYGNLLCADCQALIEIASIRRPDHSKKYLADIYSACSYENKYVKKLVHGLKYEPFCRELAMPLARIIAGHFSLAAPDFDFGDFSLAPAPLAKKRLRERGYNQSELIGQTLAKIWNIEIIAGALTKIRDTKPQVELDQAQRLQNLKDAFAANRDLVENKKILLLDDVATTGATLEGCARALRRAGAAEVIGVCAARAEG